ncbi:MAG: CDP-alcohol phosphatidyltransferase family protein [Acidobacteriota bacterium]
MRAALALPSAITFSRIALFPWISHAILNGRFGTAVWVFFFVAVTDSIDGWVARRWQLTTRFGAILDPIADKLLLVTIYASLGWVDAVPRWLVAIVFGRDVLILLLAGITMAAGRVRTFEPSRWGKLSTFVQICTAITAMVHHAHLLDWLLGDVGWIAEVMFAVCAAWTTGSGLHYLFLWWRRLSAGGVRE